MSSWTLLNPPDWFSTAVAEKSGWANPTTHEVLVAISNFEHKRAVLLEVAVDNFLLEDGSFLLLEGDVQPQFLLLE